MDARVSQRTIREVMSAPVITVQPSSGVDELKELFETHDVNAFPVVDEQGLLTGIVTKLDLLRLFRPQHYRWMPEIPPLRGERVADLMSRTVVAVGPADPVTAAVDRMLEYGLRSLPVVERRGGLSVLVGIVSRGDVLACLRLERGRAAPGA